MKKPAKYLLKGIGILLALPLVYLLAATVGSLIPVNSSKEPVQQEVEIYLRSNGVHTSLFLPLKHAVFDWTEVVDQGHTHSPQSNFRYVSFGWGDLEFYKNTPAWENLTIPTAFRALFLKTPAALNVEFFSEVPFHGQSFPVSLTEEQYAKITSYILESFDYGADGKAQIIEGLHYNQRDVFYRAKGHLNLFYTCNTWTNNAFKAAETKACLWTPFEEGIIRLYR